jgi:hypothetical protein
LVYHVCPSEEDRYGRPTCSRKEGSENKEAQSSRQEGSPDATAKGGWQESGPDQKATSSGTQSGGNSEAQAGADCICAIDYQPVKPSGTANNRAGCGSAVT